MRNTKQQWKQRILSELIVLGLAAGLSAPAAALPLELAVTGAETEMSLLVVDDGAKIGFDGPVTYDLDLDFLAGTARLSDFLLPGYLGGIDMDFSLIQVPSLLDGSVTVHPDGLAADLLFPSVTVQFNRNHGYQGSLTFDLSTTGATIPAGCAERSQDQLVAGSALDFVTGEITLVGAVCPQVGYSTRNPGFEITFDEAFRVILRGQVANLAMPIPEPGSFLLVGSGLFGLACAGRRRSRR